MGPASAYAAVLRSIRNDVKGLMSSHPEKFSFQALNDGFVDVRDFQITGVVAYARGCPFYELPPGRLLVMGQRIQVNRPYLEKCVEAIDDLVAKR